MRCYCNKKPILVVSWIANNLGRRFYGGPNYVNFNKLFEWVLVH